MNSIPARQPRSDNRALKNRSKGAPSGINDLFKTAELGENAGRAFDARRESAGSGPSRLSIYIDGIKDIPLLTADQERELAARIKSGDQAAFDHFVRANLSMVINLARRLSGDNKDLMEELIEVGNFKLLKIVRKFRPEQYNNGHFSTLAFPALYKNMLSACKNWDRKKGLTPGQMAKALSKRNPGKIVDVVARVHNPSNDPEKELDLGQQLADKGLKAPEIAAQNEESYSIHEALQDLKRLWPRHVEIVRLFFGLDPQGPLNLSEISEKLGITRQRVSEINDDAQAFIKKRLERRFTLHLDLKASRKRRLLTDALSRAYERLSYRIQTLRGRDDARSLDQAEALGALRAYLPEIPFAVNHSHPDAQGLLGWGPENGVEYQYPRKKFSTKGGIQVSLSEKFLQFLDLTQRMLRGDVGGGRYKNSAALARAAADFSAGVIAHLTLHARQYHDRPLFDYLAYWNKRTESARAKQSRKILEDMLQDQATAEGRRIDLLADTRAKIEYERDAQEIGRLFGDKQAYLLLAEALEHAMRENPADFARGGRYYLLARGRPRSMTDYYLRKEAEYLDRGKEFTPEDAILYEGQYKPMEALRGLRRLNQALRNKEFSAQDAKKEFSKLGRIWRAYMKSDLSKLLKESAPYLLAAENAYQEAVAEYKSLTAGP